MKKIKNNYIWSGSTWQQASWATDWPLFQGESTLWASDWPQPEERISIGDWLGSVIFHLNGSWAQLLCDIGRSPPLLCVSVWMWMCFLLLLNGILWAPMGPCSGGWAQLCPSPDKSHGTVCQVTSHQEACSREQILNRCNAQTHTHADKKDTLW